LGREKRRAREKPRRIIAGNWTICGKKRRVGSMEGKKGKEDRCWEREKKQLRRRKERSRLTSQWGEGRLISRKNKEGGK